MIRTRIAPVVGLLALFCCSVALAQTDAGGLFRPWPDGEHVQAQADTLFENQGHTKETGDPFRLSLYESSARWRITDDLRLNPTVGYNIEYLDLHSGNPLLPDQLTDTSVGFATPFHQFGNGWFAAGSAAIGYAGNAPYGESHGYYGRTTALIGKELSPESSLIFGIDYNGNRSILPDVPLPGVAYSFKAYPTILAVVGFPYNSLTWHPTDNLTVKASYTVPEIFEGRVEYKIVERLQVYANYEDKLEPFHVDSLPNRERLIFESHRLETGVRVKPIPDLALLAAIGYAFGQRFEAGWDTRHLDGIAHTSDEAYLRFGAELHF